MWLDCPVEETDNRGRKTRTTEARDSLRPRHRIIFDSQLRLTTADRHASVGAPEYQVGFFNSLLQRSEAG